MITYRLAVLTIRLVLASVGVFYTSLKLFIAPEANPLFILSPSAEQNLPYNTNPAFATVMILVALILSAALLLLTIRSIRRDRKAFGKPAPWSPPAEIALLGFLSLIMGYYTIIAVVVQSTSWNFPLTLATIAVVLSLYEGRQYARSYQIKNRLMGN